MALSTYPERPMVDRVVNLSSDQILSLEVPHGELHDPFIITPPSQHELRLFRHQRDEISSTAGRPVTPTGSPFTSGLRFAGRYRTRSPHPQAH